MGPQFNRLLPKVARTVSTAVRWFRCSPGRAVLENDSFVSNAFSGRIQPKQIFPYPAILTETEKKQLKGLSAYIENDFKSHDAARCDIDEKISDQCLGCLWKLNLFGASIPQEFGGLGLGHVQYAKILEYFGAKDLNVAMALRCHQNLGMKAILKFGNKEQQETYLPKLTKGTFAAFCLTEKHREKEFPYSTAILSDDGRHYVLNGAKMFVEQANLADVMTVFAMVDKPDTSSPLDLLTTFIVEKSYGGVAVSSPQKRIGLRGIHCCDVTFENVKIPAENVLGGLGNGFKVAMGVFNDARYSLAAISLGSMKTCIKQAAEHASKQKQFGRYMDTLSSIKEKIGKMSVLHYITESMTYLIAHNMDQGVKNSPLEGAILKVFASESAQYICDETIQMMGCSGCLQSVGLERLSRDLRLFRILEGTNEMQRLFIALNGIKVATIVPEADPQSVRQLNLNFSAQESPKNVLSAQLVHPNLVQFGKLLEETVGMFNASVNTTVTRYGSAISKEDFVLNRLAEDAALLYAAAVALARATKSLNGDVRFARQEELMTEAWISEVADSVKRNFDILTLKKNLDNFTKIKLISHNVSYIGGPVQTHPASIE